eukprot:1098806-Rhodomonas_salina.3
MQTKPPQYSPLAYADRDSAVFAVLASSSAQPASCFVSGYARLLGVLGGRIFVPVTLEHYKLATDTAVLTVALEATNLVPLILPQQF